MRLIALCLLCFTVQNALASAHFHLISSDRAGGVTASVRFAVDGAGANWHASAAENAAKTDLTKRAGNTNTASCPLCQFLILGSAALHPSFVAALAPVESVAFVVADQTFARFVSAVSYSWQGRGPPLI